MAPGVTGSLKPLVAELESLGFRKRAGFVFTCALGVDVLGIVGLNTAKQGRPAGSVAVNPVIGLRHQEVQRVVAELNGEEFHAYRPPTVSSPIGYLMPDRKYAEWEFDPNSAVTQSRVVREAIEVWGLSFMRENADLQAITRLAEEGFGIDYSLRYTRPVARALCGDRVGAALDIAGSLRELAPHDWPAAARFRGFAAKFDEWVA